MDDQINYQPAIDAADDEDLATKNIPLAFFLVKKYRKGFLSLDSEEMLSAAFLGLTKAATGFDPDQGIKFSSYATTIIIREFINRVKELTPHKLARTGYRQVRAMENFQEQHGRYPDKDEAFEIPELRGNRANPIDQKRYEELLLACALSKPRADMAGVSAGSFDQYHQDQVDAELDGWDVSNVTDVRNCEICEDLLVNEPEDVVVCGRSACVSEKARRDFLAENPWETDCKSCGIVFRARSKRVAYCSDKCRKAANRERARSYKLRRKQQENFIAVTAVSTLAV